MTHRWSWTSWTCPIWTMVPVGETAMRPVLPAIDAAGLHPLPAADSVSDAALVRDVEIRRAVLERLGARPLVERLRLQWDAGGPVSEPNGRCGSGRG